MKSIMRTLLVIILFSLSGNLLAQAAIEKFDKVYGLDPLLYNGKKYFYFLPPGTGGNQYLRSPDYFVGGVTIRNEHFEGVTLNYDVYNQQLLLRYADENGAFNIIEVSKAWLESFHLGTLDFEYLDLGDGMRFYQVLGIKDIRIFFYWRKDLILDIGATSGAFTFTPAMRNAYVMKQGNLYPYRSKGSFLAIFDRALKPEIKSYMRKNRIKLNKASDQSMTDLINYIGTL